MDKKIGFTLAEVLITLTIIGVIAALTIPNLMQKWQDHADVVKVKEAYSILDNAFKLAIRENGPVNEWHYGESDNNRCQKIIEELSRYLKISDYCVNKVSCAGFDTGYLRMNKSGKYLSMGATNNYAGWRKLNNGMLIGFMFWWNNNQKVGINGDGSYLGNIVLDINSFQKGPNRYGYDVFNIPFNSNGLFLKEYKEYPMMGYINYVSNCNTPSSEGMYCVPWIIKHGNMDYKYRDVSAEW